MKFYSFTSNLLCLILLPFALLGGPTALLCVGEDGHIGIEIGEDGRCSHAPFGSHGEDPLCNAIPPVHSLVCSESESDCGDCIDFALQLSEADLRWGAGLNWLALPALGSDGVGIPCGELLAVYVSTRFESRPASASSLFCASVRLRI